MEPNNNMRNDNMSEPRPVRAPGFANDSANGGDTADVVTPVNGGNDVVFQDKPKKSHGMLYGMILLAILAAGGIGFGVWAMLDGNSRAQKKDEQISQLQSQLAEKSEVVVDDDTTVAEDDVEGDSVASTSVANTADYIYVGEWGIKIKIPEELKKVSYLVDYRVSEQNEEYLYINGVVGDTENIPSFLNTPTEEFWLGCLHRLVQGEEPALRASMGALVTTIDGYEYYYGHPQAVLSTNEQDRELELKTVDSIRQMFTNVNNYSKI